MSIAGSSAGGATMRGAGLQVRLSCAAPLRQQLARASCKL